MAGWFVAWRKMLGENVNRALSGFQVGEFGFQYGQQTRMD
jgi:hypothetical protein